MTAESLYMAGALTVAGVGGITDVTSRRIPNKLTYPGYWLPSLGGSRYRGGVDWAAQLLADW